MNALPKIKLKWSNSDYWLEALSLMPLLLSLLYLGDNYSVLPDIVPTHYNLNGKVDAIGHKNHLWLLYFVFFMLYVLMTWVNRYPHRFNYLVPITEVNTKQQYTSYTKMMRILKLIVSVILGTILFVSIKNTLLIEMIN